MIQQQLANIDSIPRDSLLTAIDTTLVDSASTLAKEIPPFDFRSIVDLDSILWQKIDSAAIARFNLQNQEFRKSLIYTENAADVIIKDPIPKEIPNHFTLAFSLVFTFGVLAITRFFDRLKFENFLWGVFYRKEFERFLREDNLSFIPPQIVWFSLACFTNGVFLSQFDILKDYFHVPYSMEIWIGILTGFTAGVYLTKSFLVYLIGKIFNQEENASIYNLLIFYGLIILSFSEFIFLIYKIVADFFNNEIMLPVLSVMIVLTTLYLILRLLLTISIRGLIHVFYLILYLCTLELLPLFVLGYAIMS